MISRDAMGYAGSGMPDEEEALRAGGRRRRRIPRSFKELTPTRSLRPGSFFCQMVLKSLLTRRQGRCRRPDFPRLEGSQVSVTWIGHSSFLVQFQDLSALIDPNFANWLFWQKRVRRAGMRIEDLPGIDLVLITHAHFDHFNRNTLRRIPSPGVVVVPWGVGKLARGLGFSRVLELDWWESFIHGEWKVTFTPAKHWGARMLHDQHRGFGGYVLEHRGRSLYHAGDTAYCGSFRKIGERCRPEIAMLPIGTYYPDAFRKTHMGPDEAHRCFLDLGARWMIPMHFGSFRLSFEDMDEPPRWLRRIARDHGISDRIRILEEGRPSVF